MKKAIFFLCFLGSIGIGIRVGYSRGFLKEPVDQLLGYDSSPEKSVHFNATENPQKTPTVEPPKALATAVPEVQTPPTPPKTPVVVRPEAVEKAKKLLAEAEKLGNQVQYKKARELLKEARELQIDEVLLEQCRTLYNKYRDYDRLTRFIDPITRKDGTLDRVVFSNGNIAFGKIIEEDEDQITFEQSNGIRGALPRHRLAQVEKLTPQKAKMYFLSEFQNKKSSIEKNIEKPYSALEYACQHRLDKELHQYLEESYQKDPRFMEPLLEELARQNYKKYMWFKSQGKKEDAQSYLDRLFLAYRDTTVAQQAEEDQDPQKYQQKLKTVVQESKSLKNPAPPPSLSQNAQELERAGDEAYQKGLALLKKAQPGDPQADEYLAQAKEFLQNAIQHYDSASGKEGHSPKLDTKLEQTSEYLYFCVKQTRLKH
jgi:hypothetical protein